MASIHLVVNDEEYPLAGDEEGGGAVRGDVGVRHVDVRVRVPSLLRVLEDLVTRGLHVVVVADDPVRVEEAGGQAGAGRGPFGSFGQRA